MQPTQITPHIEAAAYHLNDTKTSQQDALQLAALLIDRLPFAATDMHIIRMRHAFRLEWGVRLDVLGADAALFGLVAEQLGAERRSEVLGAGGNAVTCHESLVGSVEGVPFEIRAYMGTQRIEVAA